MYLPGTLLATEDRFIIDDSAATLSGTITVDNPTAAMQTLATLRQYAESCNVPTLCREYWSESGHIIGADFGSPSRLVSFTRLDHDAGYLAVKGGR